MGIKLKDPDSIIFLYYFFVIKMVQAHAKREEGIKLSPVGLLFLSMRGFQAHQRLNVIFEPILCCSWGSKIRRKVIAIRKTYNDLRVGSNPSGCLHGGRKILREGTAFILVYMQTFQWEATSKDYVTDYGVTTFYEFLTRIPSQLKEPKHPLHTIPHFFLTNN